MTKYNMLKQYLDANRLQIFMQFICIGYFEVKSFTIKKQYLKLHAL